MGALYQRARLFQCRWYACNRAKLLLWFHRVVRTLTKLMDFIFFFNHVILYFVWWAARSKCKLLLQACLITHAWSGRVLRLLKWSNFPFKTDYRLHRSAFTFLEGRLPIQSAHHSTLCGEVLSKRLLSQGDLFHKFPLCSLRIICLLFLQG